ncbi:DoxX family protein [Citreimonas sp.]|uniref:DoxX family protein n=1 Tax=Citreimonas sp. TaxID=3036715 RepID=UPI004057DFDC
MTSTTNTTVLLIARIMLGLLFVVSGFGKTGDVAGFAGYMASGGIPAFLAWPVILFEILGGLALIVGFQTRAVAIALAAFTLLAGILYHFQPADQNQMTQFLKNLAITGGYLAIAITGAGAWSIDGFRGNAKTVNA